MIILVNCNCIVRLTAAANRNQSMYRSLKNISHSQIILQVGLPLTWMAEFSCAPLSQQRVFCAVGLIWSLVSSASLRAQD